MYRDKNGNLFPHILLLVSQDCDVMDWACNECPHESYCDDIDRMSEVFGAEEVDFLRPNERFASTNATVIVDDDGNVTGWFDNSNRLMLVVGEK